MLSIKWIKGVDYYVRKKRRRTRKPDSDTPDPPDPEDSDSPDYYLALGEGAGEWWGSGTERLGLSGTVQAHDLKSLCQGFGPDGTPLIQNAGASDHQQAWDFTFSVPKPLSVFWTQASAEVREIISRLIRQAVIVALTYLSTVAMLTRRGKGGKIVEHALPIVAIFEDAVSRELDPQLHRHCLVLNVAGRSDGTFGTILSKPLYRHKLTAGAVFQAELAHLLQKELGLKLEADKTGFRVAGVPEKLVEHYSTRSKQIRAKLRSKGHHSAKAAAVAALDTRKAKPDSIPPLSELLRDWQETNAQFGFTTEKAHALLGRASARTNPPNLKARIATAVQEILEGESFFSEQELIRHVASAVVAEGVPAAEIISQVRAYLLERRDLVPLASRDYEPLFTTREILRIERELLAAIERGRHVTSHVVGDHLVKRYLDKLLPLNGKLTEKERTRNKEQRKAVIHFVSGSGCFKVAEGMAGTGKTYMISVARQIWENAGYKVLGMALSAAAAANLQEGAGIESETIAMRLLQLDPRRSFASHHKRQLKRLLQGKRTYAYRGRQLRLTPKTIVVLDEAGMVGTRQLAKIVRLVSKAVMIGDRRQLQPIDAGGPFAAIADRIESAELKQVVRQKDEPDDPNPAWHSQAGQLIAAGHIAQALKLFAERGRISVLQDRDEALLSLVRDWSVAGITNPTDHIVLAAMRHEVSILNQMCQSARLSADAISPEHIVIADQPIHEGDIVLFTENARVLGVNNGDRGVVLGFNRLRKTIAVRLERTGKPVRVSYRHYTHLQLGYAMTTHKAQGATVPSVYVLLGGAMQDRHLSYVQTTRASESTRLYTDTQNAESEFKFLIRQMERERPKLLALDLLQRSTADEPSPGGGHPAEDVLERVTKAGRENVARDEEALQPSSQDGSLGEAIEADTTRTPGQTTELASPQSASSAASPTAYPKSAATATPPTTAKQPPAHQSDSNSTPPAKRRRTAGSTRPKKKSPGKTTPPALRAPATNSVQDHEVPLPPIPKPEPERRDLLDLSHVSTGMTRESQPLVSAAKRYGKVPGGIVIEGSASSEVPIESLAIDSARPGRLLVNGDLLFDTGLSSEEVALLWHAVFHTGRADKNFGVLSQVQPIGVEANTVVAHTMMTADNALGGIIYGFDAQCNLGRSSVPAYLNPFLYELTQLDDDEIIDRLYFNEVLEVHPRVFLTVSDVAFARKGDSLRLVSTNIQAALGTMQRDNVVADSPPKGELPLVSVRFPFVDRACHHFVQHFSEFAREEPAFARTLAYGELVSLFRLAKSSGASLVGDGLVSQALAKRRRTPRPQFDFTERSSDYVDALTAAVTRLCKRPQADMVLGLMEGFLALTFACRAGDLDLFLSAKRKALGFISRYRDQVLRGRHAKVAEHLPGVVERVHNTPHDYLIENCFARARDTGRPLKEREAFLEKALHHCGSPETIAQNTATRCLQLEIECYRNSKFDPLPKLAKLRANDPLCRFPYTVLSRINSRRLYGEGLYEDADAFSRIIQRRVADLGLGKLSEADKALWTTVEAELWSGDKLPFLGTLKHLDASLLDYIAVYRKYPDFHPMAVLTKLAAIRLKRLPATSFSPHFLHRNNPFRLCHELLDLDKPRNIEALFEPLWQDVTVFDFPFEIWEPTGFVQRFLAWFRRPTLRQWCDGFLKLHAVSENLRGSKVALLLAHELQARRLKVTELYEKMRQYRTKNPQAALFFIEAEKNRPKTRR
jgi:conjugative relaxase-like TrwC/TraI family protein